MLVGNDSLSIIFNLGSQPSHMNINSSKKTTTNLRLTIVHFLGGGSKV